MCRPFEASGVPLNLTTPSAVTVGGLQIAPMICYENFLVSPLLAAMMHGPDVLVGFSNTAWDGTAEFWTLNAGCSGFGLSCLMFRPYSPQHTPEALHVL